MGKKKKGGGQGKKWVRVKGCWVSRTNRSDTWGHRGFLLKLQTCCSPPALIRHQSSVEQGLWFSFTPTGWRDQLKPVRGVALSEPPSVWSFLTHQNTPSVLKAPKHTAASGCLHLLWLSQERPFTLISAWLSDFIPHSLYMLPYQNSWLCLA